MFAALSLQPYLLAILNCSCDSPDPVSHLTDVLSVMMLSDMTLPSLVPFNKDLEGPFHLIFSSKYSLLWVERWVFGIRWLFMWLHCHFWQIIIVSRENVEHLCLVVEKQGHFSPFHITPIYWVTSTHGSSCSFWQLCCQSSFSSPSHHRRLNILPRVESTSFLIPPPLQLVQLLCKWWTAYWSCCRSKVIEWNNPFMKHSSPAEVKLV